AEFVGRSSISVRCAAAVGWIVRPFSATLAGSIPLISIAVVDVVSVEIVVVVDGHVSAAIPITIPPITAPCSANGDAGAESEKAITRRVGIWIRISGRTINHTWTVLRNIN